MAKSRDPRFVSCFEKVYDVVVFGTGYAGFAAARNAALPGKRTLVVDLRGDVLWESGRAFVWDATGSDTASWTAWLKELGRFDGYTDGRLDGAVAEVIANESFHRDNPEALYYAAPVAVEMDGDLLAAATVATKGGLRRIAGRQWIDATETGTLARILSPRLSPKTPTRQTVLIFVQQASWPNSGETDLAVPELPDCRVRWVPTMWPHQRCLRVEIPGDDTRFRRVFVPVLKAARKALSGEFRAAHVSHCSVEPFRVYAAAAPIGPLPNGPRPKARNVALAAPALSAAAVGSIAERFALGESAANALANQPVCESGEALLGKPVKRPRVAKAIDADVAVIGLGTGGALAAIAAGREKARTVAVEPLAFPGGIGTGGGISSYYWGMSGGIQDEVDRRTAEIMDLFGPKDLWGHSFHPEAKKVVLDAMLAESNVTLIYSALLAGVTARKGRVESVLIATSDGPRKIVAHSWIDGTGDGDLAAWAGAKFILGRAGDGKLHAYTQSSSFSKIKDEKLFHSGVNYDSGFVDPTDSADMTRARIEGIHQYTAERFDGLSRPNYIAPQLGLREGRLIETDYTLTLDDLLERARFHDCIGLTGSHYDNHAVDYEFESDDAMFYLWASWCWRYPTACEMPYRILLPKGLDNVWIACRAVGVTADAHHSLRMQRDMQRIGEVSGVAAALAAARKCGSRQVPFDELRAKLAATGTFSLRETTDNLFGGEVIASRWADPYADLPPDQRIEKCLKDLGKPEFGAHLWHLYRAGRTALKGYVKQFLVARDETVPWKATMLLAAWGDESVEPRLLRAITQKELGPEFEPLLDDEGKRHRNVPRWWEAAAFLRFCGTPACLPVLAALAKAPDLQLDARAVVALTIERIARRCKLTRDQTRTAQETLDALTATQPPCSVSQPQRNPVTGEDGLRRWLPIAANVREDFTWQIHFAVARARKALGLGLHEGAKACLSDRRAFVRNAFATLTRER